VVRATGWKKSIDTDALNADAKVGFEKSCDQSRQGKLVGWCGSGSSEVAVVTAEASVSGQKFHEGNFIEHTHTAPGNTRGATGRLR
jgi:hypothetical protein